MVNNDTIQSVLLLANMAEEQASRSNNATLFSHAQRAKRLALTLQGIEDLAFRTRYSQVDIKLYCYTGDGRNVVDFEVVGVDEWGHSSDITSNLNMESVLEALNEIASSHGEEV